MIAIESKLPGVGETIFGEMNTVAGQCGAVNLGQGFPDFPPDRALTDAVAAAMTQGHNQYAPMAGVPALREAIADKIHAQHLRRYDAETEITVTAGASEALMSTILALVGTGDEVLLIDPAYDLYAPAIQLAGARPVRVGMCPPNTRHQQFRLDWESVADTITPSTRMLVLNFPHNPTGLALRAEDLDALEALVARHPLIVLSDEAYEHIVFDGREHLSPVRRDALAVCTVLVSSFGKTFHTTGWKIGYCCAPAPLMQEIRKVHQFNVFSVNTPMQHGIAHYLRATRAVDQLSGFYQQKRDYLARGLENTALKPLPSEATFFLLVDMSALGRGSEKELAVRLAREAGVAGIPVSAFYAEPSDPMANHQLLRLCFAKQDRTLDAALERLSVFRP